METLRAGCKINLFLHLLGRREDGYHDLFSLFLPLDEPHDELRVRAGQGGFRLSCVRADGTRVDLDPENNTVTAAWRRYAEISGCAPALDVELVKAVPQGAGLGGGSADAAEMLLYLNRRNPHPLDKETLGRIAARIGADVPFFLQKRPCLVEGVGEKLTPLPPQSPWLAPLAGAWGLLICPDIHVSTAWAYAAWDEAQGKSALTDPAAADRNHASFFFPPPRVENGFEPVVFARWPELEQLKLRLLRAGAFAAGMSGSGSSIFGIFRHAEDAHEAAAQFRGSSGLRLTSGPFPLLGQAG